MSTPAPATDGLVRARPDGPAEAYLPTRTVQSHAANLAVLPDGDLGCVWFGGTQEGVADISVWFSRLPAGGDRWRDPVRLSDDAARSEQNPVLFAAPNGELWLLHTAQHAGEQDTAVVRARVSGDSGRTWGPVRELLSAPNGGIFVRQPPVVLPSGRWLLPTFACPRVPGRAWSGEQDTSSVWFSDDEGGSWREVPVPESTGRVHMSIVPRPGGGLTAFFRSRWADHVYRSASPDGTTWEPPRPTGLPNNNSSIQAVTLPDGRIALAFNDSSRRDAVARRVSLYDEIDGHGILADAVPQVRAVGDDDGDRTAFWGAPRAPLVLAVSADGGSTWPLRRLLADGDGYALSNNSRDGINRELSYPSVAVDAVGDLHVAFTYHRRAIRHLRIPVQVLRCENS
ncbi:exo-alpha-sialidase [Micromonospora yasonensis]|uniref:sialidase family protein n=1 Tax=Micromonospora yasonensis TaxID=1128667 RepID=UPI00222EBB48|nr:exo-alpha-sialidase [Micromonospora yasonensis]MCW3839876.1 exo-alpha-sialidase [Micromonospora yasonensis]